MLIWRNSSYSQFREISIRFVDWHFISVKSIKDFDVNNKRVLVRCDFNVPIEEHGDGSVSDDFRIKKTLPTIRYLIENKAKIILISHLGEPEGKVTPILTLDKVKERLEMLLGKEVLKTDDCIGPEVEKKVSELNSGEILLLENVRFHKEETENDSEFAKQLANLGDIYINDAFGDSHRAHASMVGIPQYLPHGAGFLLEKKI